MVQNSLFSEVLSVLVPASLSDFQLVSVEELPSCIIFRLEDAADKIPEEIKNEKNVVACKTLTVRGFQGARISSETKLQNNRRAFYCQKICL
jgi:hypothetical protein